MNMTIRKTFRTNRTTFQKTTRTTLLEFKVTLRQLRSSFLAERGTVGQLKHFIFKSGPSYPVSLGMMYKLNGTDRNTKNAPIFCAL